MQIITYLNTNGRILDASVVTIGNFDGVHLGHAEIFAHLKRKSATLAFPSVAITFEPHPLKILSPKLAPQLITTFEQKAALIDASGIDYLVVIPFSKEFSQTIATDFVLDILCGALGMRHIIIGHDYAFGKGREGDFAMLQSMGIDNGFTVEDLPPIGEGEIVFSSSLARSEITDGNLAAASKILGRYYQIAGTVVHGREIGQSLGFPTANIVTPNELIPGDGVYAVIVSVDGQLVKGACNIGKNPTFLAVERTIEVFLLDFSGLIYGKEIAVYFVERLRDVKKFHDADSLMDAISKDIERTRIILNDLDERLIKISIPVESH